MESLTREQAEDLTDELTELSKEQSKALQTAAYFRMNPHEAKKYDERRERISELSTILGKFKPSAIEQ